MFIASHAVKVLVDFLQQFLQPEIIEQQDFDANDFVILHSFILPELQQAITSGVDSHQLMQKGWGILAGLMPQVLRSETISDESYGVLARAAQLYFLQCAEQYIGYIEDSYYRENQERINAYIDAAIAVAPCNPKPFS